MIFSKEFWIAISLSLLISNSLLANMVKNLEWARIASDPEKMKVLVTQFLEAQKTLNNQSDEDTELPENAEVVSIEDFFKENQPKESIDGLKTTTNEETITEIKKFLKNRSFQSLDVKIEMGEFAKHRIERNKNSPLPCLFLFFEGQPEEYVVDAYFYDGKETLSNCAQMTRKNFFLPLDQTRFTEVEIRIYRVGNVEK